MYVRFGHVRECRGVMLRNVAICVSCDRSDCDVCVRMNLATRRSHLDKQLCT